MRLLGEIARAMLVDVWEWLDRLFGPTEEIKKRSDYWTDGT